MSTVIELTNMVASQALRGQNVKITVDLAEEGGSFSQLQVGQLSDGGNYYVYSIDTFGNTFEIAPYQLNFNLSPSSNGYWEVSEVASIVVD